MLRFGLLTLLIGLLAAQSQQPQQPPKPTQPAPDQPDGPRISVSVENVMAPVLVFNRDGNTVSVKIYRILPPGIMCTMQLVPYDENIKLDGSFDSGEYRIDVNGTVVNVKI